MSQKILDVSLVRYWKLALIAGLVILLAAIGTYISGQYRIGRLDALIKRYENPVVDFAAANSKARAGTLEAELLEGCKQAQIGTWLQTTDALKFKDPVSGNRVIVVLEPGRDYIDINGREVSGCVVDEIETRQYDIGSMTNTWAVCLAVMGLALVAAGYIGRRRQSRAGFVI